jgi:hypothetical protein
MTGLRALAIALLVAVVVPSARAGTQSGTTPPSSNATAGDASKAEATGGWSTRLGERTYVLLRDNRLIVVDTRTGRVILRRALGRKPALRVSPGRRLAIAADARTLFVLVAGTPDAVAVLNARTMQVRARLPLEVGIQYRALVLSPTGDRLHVFGNRPGRVVDRDRGNRLREEAAVVTSLELGTRARSTMTVREADGRSWFIYWATTSDDGRRLVVTYHGGCSNNTRRCTGGADWLDVTSTGMLRCPEQEFPASGCTGQVHGMVEAYRDGFVAARGLPAIGVVDHDLRQVRLLQTHLRTHLMDFALSGRTVYALGDCAKGTGLRAVSIEADTSRRLGPRWLCGERIAVGRRTLAISTIGRFTTGTVTLLDRGSGRVIRELSVASDPVDVVTG